MKHLVVDLPSPAGVDASLLQHQWVEFVKQQYAIGEVWHGTSPMVDDWMVLTTAARRSYWVGLAPVIYIAPDAYELTENVLPRSVWALRRVSGDTAGNCAKVIEKYGSIDEIPDKAKKWAQHRDAALNLMYTPYSHPNTLVSTNTPTDPNRNLNIRSTPRFDYQLCTDVSALLQRCGNAPYFAIDFEYGKDQDDEDDEDKDVSRAPVGVSLSWDEGHAEYIPMQHTGADNFDVNVIMPQLLQLCLDAHPVMWNAKADMQVMMLHSGNIDETALKLFDQPPDDAMLIAYMSSLQPLALKKRTYFDLGIRMQEIKELIGKKPKQIPFSQVPVEKAVPYGCQDADMTLRHWYEKWPELYDRGQQIYLDIERPLAVILAHAELKGIPFDRERLTRMWCDHAMEMRNLEHMIFTLASIQWNLAANEQTACVLYNKLGLPPQSPTKAFKPSVAADALYPIARMHAIIPLYLRWRKLSKLEVGFFAKLLAQPTDWIHSKMNQNTVGTGRLSSKEPNMQQNPPEVRGAIVAPPGYNLGAADESQLELRIMAKLADCRIMLQAYLSDPPEDLHELTRKQCGLEDRRPAKVANFLTQYGGQAARFQIALAKNGIYWTLRECADFLRLFMAGRPEIPKYWESMNEFTREHGYAETLDGRRRYIDNIDSAKPDERGNAERQAGNHPVQGSGSDFVKRGMVRSWRRIVELGGWLPLQVHDEILTINKPEDNEEVKQLLALHMTTPNLIAPVPLIADIHFGASWGEVH